MHSDSVYALIQTNIYTVSHFWEELSTHGRETVQIEANHWIEGPKMRQNAESLHTEV